MYQIMQQQIIKRKTTVNTKRNRNTTGANKFQSLPCLPMTNQSHKRNDRRWGGVYVTKWIKMFQTMPGKQNDPSFLRPMGHLHTVAPPGPPQRPSYLQRCGQGEGDEGGKRGTRSSHLMNQAIPPQDWRGRRGTLWGARWEPNLQSSWVMWQCSARPSNPS